MYNYTEGQIRSIKEAIEGKLGMARENLMALDSICDEDYLKGRGKYPLSAIVYSAFNLDDQSVPGLIVQKIQYGKGRFMPELYNKDVVIQLYSDTAHFLENNEVKNKINAFGTRFEVIRFWINKDTYELDRLQQITFSGIIDEKCAKIDQYRDLIVI